eukprot:357877-Prorocentrum_minimum.AAC.2
MVHRHSRTCTHEVAPAPGRAAWETGACFWRWRAAGRETGGAGGGACRGTCWGASRGGGGRGRSAAAGPPPPTCSRRDHPPHKHKISQHTLSC